MKITAKDMARVGVFAALHVAAAVFLRFGGESLVPFSLVPFMAFLAAFALGGRLGSLSLVVYCLLGLLGLPVFAKAPYGGLVYVLQPTFGFVLGFIVSAWAVGKVNIAKNRGALLAVVLGVVLVYAVGVPYFYAMLRFYFRRSITWGWVFSVAVLPYLALDLVKAGVAVHLGRKLQAQLRNNR